MENGVFFVNPCKLYILRLFLLALYVLLSVCFEDLWCLAIKKHCVYIRYKRQLQLFKIAISKRNIFSRFTKHLNYSRWKPYSHYFLLNFMSTSKLQLKENLFSISKQFYCITNHKLKNILSLHLHSRIYTIYTTL